MFIKKIFSFILLFFVYQHTIAQDTLQYFLTSNQEPTEKVNAPYVLKVYKEKAGDILWKRDWLTKPDYKLLSTGYCKDSLGKTKEGHFDFFSYEGVLIQTGQFENGKAEGEWKQQYSSGKKLNEYHYHKGKMVGLSREWYENGTLKDSFDLDKNGNGYGVGFYENGLKTYEGMFSDGIKKGAWKYYYNQPGSQQSMECVFENDSLLSSKCFTKDGKPQTKDCAYGKEAGFKGGSEAWVKYLTKSILKSKYTKQLAKGLSYTVVIKFTVGLNGDITEATVETAGTNDKLDKIAEGIISNSPKWEPALQYNQPVNAYRRQPITFVTIE